jgi:hypothetical protein
MAFKFACFVSIEKLEGAIEFYRAFVLDKLLRV